MTHLGTGTVKDTPDLSSGLPAISTASARRRFELERLLQSGREYDFLMSRGILDCTTGSGMRTQVSSKCTPGALSSSRTADEGMEDSVGSSTDGEQAMVDVGEKGENMEARGGGYLGHGEVTSCSELPC